MSDKQVYVMQDGADFYVYDGNPTKDEAESLETHTAPIKVHDYDMEAAKAARSWFMSSVKLDGTINWL